MCCWVRVAVGVRRWGRAAGRGPYRLRLGACKSGALRVHAGRNEGELGCGRVDCCGSAQTQPRLHARRQRQGGASLTLSGRFWIPATIRIGRSTRLWSGTSCWSWCGGAGGRLSRSAHSYPRSTRAYSFRPRRAAPRPPACAAQSRSSSFVGRRPCRRLFADGLHRGVAAVRAHHRLRRLGRFYGCVFAPPPAAKPTTHVFVDCAGDVVYRDTK